jgi:hypothetical protein
MFIPYVIDNQADKMVDVLGSLLEEDQGRFLDVERICSDKRGSDQSPPPTVAPARMIERDDLRLICFDVICA